MKSKNPTRDQDQLIIPEGYYVEPYTPATGQIVSSALSKKLKYAKMVLSEDANVTFKSAKGNQVTAFPLSKGPQSFLVSEISVVSAGSVLIVHDGIIDTGDDNSDNFTSSIY